MNIGGFSRLSLKEKDNYDCIFWEEGGCSVYKARPVQCSTYPFWSNNLGSKDDWNHLARLCPGANRGRLYSMREIKDRLQQRVEEPLLEGDE